MDEQAVASEQLERTIEAVVTLHMREEEAVSPHQRAIERVTRLLGRPFTIYVIAATAVAWIALNLALGPRALDPAPFFWLQGVVGLAALVMTVMIVATQNPAARQSDRRAQLDLQVNLLAERKIAKVIELLEELRRDLPNVRDRSDIVAVALSRSVDPAGVLNALDEILENPPTSSKRSEK
jgi:uncharacterized membrane protein